MAARRKLSAVPAEILILGKRYSVTEDKSLIDDGTASGLCKPWRCEIRIGTGQHIQQRRDTILHEVMHAVFSEMGLTSDFKDDDDEEKIVRRLSTGLLQVLRDNPQFVKCLTEE